ncbi:hypothetical protein D3C77_627690 [compost metagenome]
MKKGAMVPVLAGAGKPFLTLCPASAPECGDWLRLAVAPFCPAGVHEVLPRTGFGAPGYL